jgi:hypothetical protein
MHRTRHVLHLADDRCRELRPVAPGGREADGLVHEAIMPASHCPERETPFLAVKRPARNCRTPMQEHHRTPIYYAER